MQCRFCHNISQSSGLMHLDHSSGGALSLHLLTLQRAVYMKLVYTDECPQKCVQIHRALSAFCRKDFFAVCSDSPPAIPSSVGVTSLDALRLAQIPGPHVPGRPGGLQGGICRATPAQCHSRRLHYRVRLCCVQPRGAFMPALTCRSSLKRASFFLALLCGYFG